jgi:hypothetical protein
MVSVREKAKCVLWLAETESPVTVQRMFRAQYGKNPPDVKLKFTCRKIYSVTFIVKILEPVLIRVIICRHLVYLARIHTKANVSESNVLFWHLTGGIEDMQEKPRIAGPPEYVEEQNDSKLLSLFPWLIHGNPDNNLDSPSIIHRAVMSNTSIGHIL